MKFKIDENLPVDVAELFRKAGYDAFSVTEQKLNGESDPHIIRVCQREARTLVTLDLDFADVRTYPPEQFAGLIVLRLPRQDKPFVLDVLSRVIPLFEHEPVARRLWIVEQSRVRIHGDKSL